MQMAINPMMASKTLSIESCPAAGDKKIDRKRRSDQADLQVQQHDRPK